MLPATGTLRESPPARGASALFNGANNGLNPAQSGNRSITLDGAQTLGSLYFNNDLSTFTNSLASNRGSTGTRFDPNRILAGRDASTADKVVDIVADRLNLADAPPSTRQAWIDYLNTNDAGQRVAWTNTAANIDKKVRGLVHLMLTSPYFQFA